MLQNKKYQQQRMLQNKQHQQKLMLQKKDYQQQHIKKPIVENQTSGKIKTNVTKEGLPTTTPTKIPTTPTKRMLQKKDYQQHHKTMLQNKEYNNKKIPTTPTKTNVTKEGLPTTTTTIKKSIVENQTSGKIKTNATKEGLPTTTIPTINECYKTKYQQELPTTTKIPTTPTKTNATKEGLPTTTPTIKKPIVENQTSGKIKTNATKEGLPTTTPTKIPTTPTKTNATKEGLPTTTPTKIPSNTNKN